MKGDITLRFHSAEDRWEIMFEDSENKIHSNKVDTLDIAFENIVTLIKMMA